jgi:hypothetical protein
MTNPVCNILGTLVSTQAMIFDQVNRRVAALRRLAEILEQAGDLNILIPDINKFIPIAQIDTLMYDQLRQACPALGLPPFTGVNDLKATVANAYARVQTYLQNCPYNRMGSIQEKLDSYLSKVTQATGPWDYLNWMNCVQFAACDFPSAVAAEVSNARSLFERQVAVFSIPINPETDQVKLGVNYVVRGEPGTSVTYDGKVYAPGDTFVGNRNATSFTTNGASLFAKPYVTSDIQRQKMDDVNKVLEWIDANGKL